MENVRPIGGALERPDDDYAPLLQFAKECNCISYERFDSSTIHRVNLFALRENFDFDGLEEALDRILRTLSPIKRIFARPIIRLRDTSAILPVESVRIVNNQTIVHASVHSELWDNISEDGLRPRKLLTVQNEDHYSIYENLVFVRAVRIILQFVSRNMRLLTNMLYANRDMRFNLLERVNHLEYFLAIGKLHIGYVRDYDKYRTAADRCLDKLLFIDRVIRARLNSPVYQQCKKYKGTLVLKKTNVFRMHKDYHRIYLLMKWFSEAKIGETEEDSFDSPGSGEGYGLYCSMLALFAVGHFNFTFNEVETIDFYRLRQSASFSAWKLTLETVFCGGVSALRITLAKDRTYRILLLPSTDPAYGRQVLEQFYGSVAADEYLTVSPVEEAGDHVCLSLYDIESFRRLQQILLKGMLGADAKRDVCPFCGRPLTDASGDLGVVHECGACRTQISQLICPETDRPYTVTGIKNYVPVRESKGASVRKDSLLYGKYVEAQLHFRNITPISDTGEPICPHCRKVHRMG